MFLTAHDARRPVAAVAAGWIAAAAALAGWLSWTDVNDLREQLRRSQFWSLELQFWLFVILTSVNLPSVMGAARRLGAPFSAAVIASAIAWLLTTQAAPRTNRIYFDEHIYQHIGQNLSDLRLAQMCNEGSMEYGPLRCMRGEYNKQPYGYSHVLSVAYRAFGAGEMWAFRANNLSAAALVVVVFLMTALLFHDGRAAAFAALVTALIPEQLRWSNTAAVEPLAALTCAIALLASINFARERSTRSLLWMIVSVTFAIEFRQESLLIVPVVAAVVVLLAREELGNWHLWAAGLLAVACAAVALAHLVAVRGESWGSSGDRLSLAYLGANLRVNGSFYVADWRFPALYSFLAMTALLMAGTVRARVIAAMYFLLFWGIFLFFYAGSYNYGADVRYSLMTYPPLAMLAGAGLAPIDRWLRSRAPLKASITFGLGALVGVQFLLYMPYVRSVGEEAWAARADVEFAREFNAAIPKDGIVLTHTPSMFLLWGTSALQTSIGAGEPNYVRQQLAQHYRGGVYLHWGFWCGVNDPVQTSFCSGVLNQFPSELVLERSRASYRYALYRLF